MTLAAWYAMLLMQAALVWRLRRERSLFMFLMFIDLITWSAMVAIDLWFPRLYVPAYIAIQPTLIALLAAACIEIQAALTNRRQSWTEPAAIVAAAAVGAVWLQSEPLQQVFIARGIVTVSMAWALLATMLWTRGPDIRAAIMVAFCALDAWAYMRLLFSMSPKYAATGPLMVGQAMCMAAWLAFELPTEPDRPFVHSLT